MIHETDDSTTDTSPGKKERFLGMLGRVPLVNRVVRRLSPTTKDTIQRTELAFTISSRNSDKITETATSIYRDVLNILEAPKLSNEKAREQIDSFRKDLPRFNRVNFTLGTTRFDESSLDNDEKREAVRRKNLDAFCPNVVDEARISQIEWLTKDHVLLMLSYLQQSAAQDVIVALKQNTRVMRRVVNQNGNVEDILLAHIFPLQTRQDRVVFNLSIEDMSVTMEYQQYLHCSAGIDIDPDQLQKDLHISVQLVIDFSALSPNQQQVLLPNADAVTETVEMRAISPDLYFNVSNQVLDLMNKSRRNEFPSPNSIDSQLAMSRASSSSTLATGLSPESLTLTSRSSTNTIDEEDNASGLVHVIRLPEPDTQVSAPASGVRDTLSRSIFSIADKLSNLPIINPALEYIFKPAAQTYTVSSAMIEQDQYPHGDINNYVADMLHALYVNDDTEVNEVAALAQESLYEQFIGDLNRFDIVKSSLNGDGNVSAEATDLAQRFVNRKRYVEDFLDGVTAQAKNNGKLWVTPQKLHGIVGHLSQGIVAEARIVLENNSRIAVARHVGDAPKVLPNLWPINKFDNFPLIANLRGVPAVKENLSIDNERISLTYKMYLHAYELGAFGIDIAEVQRDLELTITTTIDFSQLSATPGEFAPNSDGITQTITVQPFARGINFEFTNQIAELKKQEFLQEHTYNVATPLPQITDVAADANDQLGLWNAFKRRLYVPNFLSRQEDLPEQRHEIIDPGVKNKLKKE